jgi:hypothetical protein
MTNPNTERKPGTYLVLIIVGFLIALLLTWVGIRLFDRDDKAARYKTHDTTRAVPSRVDGLPAQVKEFENFIRDNSARETMGLNHNYTSDGIRHLADALGAIADQQGISDTNFKDKLDMLHVQADRLQQDRLSTEHADIIRDAFTLASDLIASFERQIAPDMKDDVTEVRRTAEAIDPNKLALDQKTGVESFFKKSSLLLNELARHRG